MRLRLHTSERGLAALEAGLLMPVLAAILFLLVEGATIISTYSSLYEASHVAARQILLTEDDTNINEIVAALLPSLNADNLSTTVSYEDSEETVTVEISYAYQPIFNGSPLGTALDTTITLATSASMPMP